jgi:hypothetical protein
MYASWLWSDHANRRPVQIVTVRTIDDQLRHWSGFGHCRVMGHADHAPLHTKPPQPLDLQEKFSLKELTVLLAASRRSAAQPSKSLSPDHCVSPQNHFFI